MRCSQHLELLCWQILINWKEQAFNQCLEKITHLHFYLTWQLTKDIWKWKTQFHICATPFFQQSHLIFLIEVFKLKSGNFLHPFILIKTKAVNKQIKILKKRKNYEEFFFRWIFPPSIIYQRCKALRMDKGYHRLIERERKFSPEFAKMCVTHFLNFSTWSI